jgi:outer membrane protein assembly factor BamB
MKRLRRRSLAVLIAVLVLSGCDWTQFRFGPAHTGFNPFETKLNVANVSQLQQTWTGNAGPSVVTSPAIVNGVAYVGSTDDNLYAFDAKGNTNCSGAPKTCVPLWTANTGAFASSPAVVNGVAYEGSDRLSAFDANGNINCSGTPKTCAPLWTGSMGNQAAGSPVVANGYVYIIGNHTLLVFDAKGNINCSGIPKTCAPLWTATGGGNFYDPAVVNGTVYLGAGDGKLYAIDAKGNINCSGTPKTCAPLWTATAGGNQFQDTPAVANGVVYIGAGYFPTHLYAFDATGSHNCSGTPKTCTPLWSSAAAGDIIEGPPAVDPAIGTGVVYISSASMGGSSLLSAFDAAGRVNCSGIPKVCQPIGTAAGIFTAPVVANGVLYVGSSDGNMYAFDAAGSLNCSGSPATCTPIWSAAAGNNPASPVVVNGTVYVGLGDGNLDAFALP